VAGFVSSVADTIFEKITGKNVGDTVLAWVEKEFSNPTSAIASTTPAPQSTAAMQPAAIAPASLDSIVIPGQDAVLTAPTRKSVDQDLALRATTAYRSTIDITGKAASNALH
jgi:serine/threonine-protein kinase RIO1